MDDWVNYFKGQDRNILEQCSRSKRLIELVIEFTAKDGRVLEAGCGTGLLSFLLADYGFKVTALDASKEVLEYARAKINLNSGRLEFVQGDILELASQYEGKYFNTVCHSGVMEHFSDRDIVRGLSEQKKIAKRVIFSIPNSRNRLGSGHFGDERFLDNKKWLGLIREAGFRHIQVCGDYDLHIPGYAYFVLPEVLFRQRFSFWWKWFSRHSIFVCE